MNAGDPLVRCNGGEVLEGLKVLIYHNNRGFFFFYGNFLPLKCLNGIHDAVGDDRVENINQVLLVGQTIPTHFGKELRNLLPLLASLTTIPDPLRRELFPIREVLNPLHLCLCQESLLSAEYVPSKSRGHITHRGRVLLHLVVEEIHEGLSVRALLRELAGGHPQHLCLLLTLILLLFSLQQRVLKLRLFLLLLRLLWLNDLLLVSVSIYGRV